MDGLGGVVDAICNHLHIGIALAVIFKLMYRYLRHQVMILFFFFQAEDGIRDIGVTGVQTCALPICRWPAPLPSPRKTSRRPCKPRRPCPSPYGRPCGAGGPDRRVRPPTWSRPR